VSEARKFGGAAARLCGQTALLLGWSPARFWAATPEELACVLGAATPAGGEGMTRAALDALMKGER
jgi:uncharacterized phage protein (TIGR02216 family)